MEGRVEFFNPKESYNDAIYKHAMISPKLVKKQ